MIDIQVRVCQTSLARDPAGIRALVPSVWRHIGSVCGASPISSVYQRLHLMSFFPTNSACKYWNVGVIRVTVSNVTTQFFRCQLYLTTNRKK